MNVVTGKAVLGTCAALSLGLALTACGGSTPTKSASGPSASDSTSASASPSTPAGTPASSPASAPVSALPSPSASSRSAATSAPASGGPSTSSAPAKCVVGELTAKVDNGSPGAGQRYATIRLTNIANGKCTIYGYGGMQLLSANGQAIPTKMVRVAPAPTTVTLAPGEVASSLLHWTVIPGPGEPQTGNCEPTAVRAAVTPPDETHSITVTWDSGPVCDKGSIDQRPYVAGTGG